MNIVRGREEGGLLPTLSMLFKLRSGEGEGGKEWTEEVELFNKVIIEEAIEDGIGAGRGDSNHVADQEGQHHVLWNNENHFTFHI